MSTPTRDRVLEVGVAGLGVGAQHARAFHAAGCAVRLLCDADLEKAANVARVLGKAETTDSFDRLVDDAELDVIAIATYDEHHCSQTVAALDAGKHVFVEKPLARSVAELATIKSVWKQANGRTKLASNLILRAAPVYGWLREAIATGELGEVYAFDGDYLYGRLPKLLDGWRGQTSDYSVMMGGGIHMVDLLLWLLGERPSTVQATGNRLCSEGTAFQGLDYVAATLSFPRGMIARITANFGCVHRHQHVVRVFGTKGTFIYDDLGPRISNKRDPSDAQMLSLSALPRSKGELIPAFVNAVRNGEDISGETQDFFDGVSVCAAADNAVNFARPIDVEYV